MESKEQNELLKTAINELLDSADLSTVVTSAVALDHNLTSIHPRTALLHVRFNEDEPQVDALARFLWNTCTNYALSRRRRIAFQKVLQEAGKGDLSKLPDIMRVVREVFIEFREKYPNRASEVGEVLAYCIAVDHLKAAQMAAKVSLKTSGNMPIHGLDGIHATFEQELTIYFLESKLSKTANEGAKDFAASAAGFLKNEKQYLREYEIVADLGNLDTLEGEARELALKHFDVVGSPDISRRQRSVGVICYSEKKHFANTIPVSNGPIDAHEKHFSTNYAMEYDHHKNAARKHLMDYGANPNKCIVFYVAVPDVDLLRKKFYEAMGIGNLDTKPDKAKGKVKGK